MSAQPVRSLQVPLAPVEGSHNQLGMQLFVIVAYAWCGVLAVGKKLLHKNSSLMRTAHALKVAHENGETHPKTREEQMEQALKNQEQHLENLQSEMREMKSMIHDFISKSGRN